MTARRTRKIIAQKSVTTENNSNPQFTSNNQLMKDSNTTISPKPPSISKTSQK